jgi:hypothetical protein
VTGDTATLDSPEPGLWQQPELSSTFCPLHSPEANTNHSPRYPPTSIGSQPRFSCSRRWLAPAMSTPRTLQLLHGSTKTTRFHQNPNGPKVTKSGGYSGRNRSFLVGNGKATGNSHGLQSWEPLLVRVASWDCQFSSFEVDPGHSDFLKVEAW